MRSLLAGLAFFVLISCGDKVPDGIIAQNQMPSILLDVHLADGHLSSMPIDSARAHLDSYYEAIFNRYGIDSVTFERSVKYYAGKPRIMNEFYSTIEQRLKTMNTEAQQTMNVQYESRRAADSIRRIHQSDSLSRIGLDSVDYLRKRHLLFLHSADSVYGKPVPVTHERLGSRLGEQLRFLRPADPNPSVVPEDTSDEQRDSTQESPVPPTLTAPGIEK